MADDAETKAKRKKHIDSFGWAKVSHLVTFDYRISDGAFRTYVVIMRYWSQHNRAWIGIPRLAEVRAKPQRIVKRHVAELVKVGLIKRQRRLGMTSLTTPVLLDEVYNLRTPNGPNMA